MEAGISQAQLLKIWDSKVMFDTSGEVLPQARQVAAMSLHH